MKTKLALSAVAAAAVALFSQGAFAQAASAPTRAEVKADAKTGSPPAGEAVGPAAKTPAGTMSTRSRAERKETTKMEAKSGGLKPAGEAATMKDEKAEKAKTSAKTRAERKAETKADIKAGATQPAGEAAQATPSGAPKK